MVISLSCSASLSFPAERSHGEMVVCSFTNSELFFEILERVETVRSVEFFAVLSVASLNFPVVSWCIRLNQLVPNPKLCKCFLKEGRFGIFGICQTVSEFTTIVRLNALNGIRKTLNQCLMNRDEEYVLCSGKASR